MAIVKNNLDNMTEDSKYFEQEIARIHELIEESGSVVTWNDKILDPDNPDQKRQIDFTIRKDDLLTVGECRIRQRPQDVMWIEELIGRKISLMASSVIAVSNSGFTEGAIKKANTHGIFLRDIRSLTDQEIYEWGNSIKAKVHYLKIESLVVQLIHSGKLLNISAQSEARKEFYQDKSLLILILQEIYNKIDVEEYTDKSGTIKTKVDIDGCQLGSHDIHMALVSFRFYLREVSLSAPYIRTYGKPEEQPEDRNVTIENIYEAGISEAIQNGDRAAMLINLSSIKIPPSSAMISTRYDFQRVVTCRIRSIGQPSVPISFEKMVVSLSFKPTEIITSPCTKT